MEIYRTTSKKINGLVLICNETLATINNKIQSYSNPEVIRVYTVYNTALNLLILYSSKWTYNRKKMALLKKMNNKIKNKLSELYPEIITQFRVIINCLIDLSKKYDNPHLKSNLYKTEYSKEEKPKEEEKEEEEKEEDEKEEEEKEEKAKEEEKEEKAKAGGKSKEGKNKSQRDKSQRDTKIKSFHDIANF